MNIAIISCVKTKKQGRMKAKELYCSALFKYSYKYASTYFDKVFILSTLYGLLEPDDCIDHYELTLNSMTAKQKHDWAIRTAKELTNKTQPTDILHYFCGLNYRKNLIKKLPNPYTEPLKGLSFGQQLRWYKERIQL